MVTPTFETHNWSDTITPVIISVPHAGRDYRAVKDELRVPLRAVLALEDRYVDLAVERAIDAKFATLISRLPRLAIDLNRDLDELDPAMVDGAPASGQPLSARARSGLGLIPARVTGVGELWRRRLPQQVVMARIDTHYRAYHHALSDRIERTARRFGAAILMDVHSMPPLADLGGADIVLGDRFGRTATRSLVSLAAAIAERHGLRVAFNAPYAGGYIVTRHARPELQRYAIQVEIDRSLYLDAALTSPAAGLSKVQAMLADMAKAMSHELTVIKPLAAE